MKITTGTTLAEIAECCTSIGEGSTLKQLDAEAYLVVFPWDERGDGVFDTHMLSASDEETDAGPAIRETVKARASAVSFSGAEAFLVPVTKSSRNPFADLITLGRARNNDLVLNSPSVSKVHAWFLNGGPTGWFIQDNGSTNGTTHNDEPAAAKTNLSLRFGDTVGFGGVQAVFCDGDGVLELSQRY